MSLYKVAGFPKKGWQYEGTIDYKEENGEYTVCDYCDQTGVRYVHILSHVNWPDSIYVGCECAIKLQCDYSEAYLKEKERDLIATYQKYLRFASDKKWECGTTSYGNKYLTRIYKGHIFKIWINSGRDFGCSRIKSSKYGKDVYYGEKFRTLDEAKRFLFDEFYKD